MRRNRILRLLLLALLVPFVVVLVLMIKPLPGRIEGQVRPAQTEVDDLKWIRVREGQGSVGVVADKVVEQADGRVRFRGIQRLVLEREDGSPVVLSAEQGEMYDDEAGTLVVRLEGGVRLEDEGEGLVLKLSALEIEDAAAEARSLGRVDFEGPDYTGTAERLVYSLDDRPSRIERPEVRSDRGTTLTAREAVLLDGLRDIEFEGQVHVVDGPRELRAERLRMQLDADGRLRRVTAASAAAEQPDLQDISLSSARADRIEVEWDDGGQVTVLLLDGNALLRQGVSSLISERIEARRLDDGRWQIDARGDVLASTVDSVGPAVLTARELRWITDLEGRVESGAATGDLRFESSNVRADAERGTFEREEIVLWASEQRRARLARDRSRVTADRIVTDRSGSELDAVGRVEASLLPRDEARQPSGAGLFRSDEAVHFVAARMKGELARNVVEFVGGVRGWQGDRNLAAERMVVDQDQDRLQAYEQVTTRIPKRDSPSISTVDFVQITAGELDYRGAEHLARYRQDVRVRQAEGWMEADEIQIELAREGGGIEELRGTGDVRFEFHDSEGPPVTGNGDRVRYLPAASVVTLFGDKTQAVVRRSGPAARTAAGRVLTYRLDTGSIEVQSGDRDRATIRTSNGP